MEACYLGCAVLSLQPGGARSDPLPTNAWGASVAIYDEKNLGPILEKFLFDDDLRAHQRMTARALPLTTNSARQVADLAYSILTSSLSRGANKR